MSEPYEPWKNLRVMEATEAQLMLLGVTDQDLAYRDSLMQVTSHMIGAALRTPYGSGYYERLNRPNVGDLVMEYTRGWWSADLRVRAWSFGVLLAQREEWWTPPGSGNHGPTYYVRWGRGAEDVQRWENSQFMLIPIGRSDFGA